MNKWFSSVFLPSIFGRCGADKGMWLSQKQTAICVDNMERRTVRYDSDGYGTMHSHDNYFTEWEGRNVSLSYSKKNGCGYISFGMNAEETEAHKLKVEEERERIKAERIERVKRNPERLAKRLANLMKKLENAQKEYQLDLEEGEETYIEYDLEEIASIKAEIELYA